MMFKIQRLKRKARSHYKAYHRELDSMSCGKHMAEQMNPRVYEHKNAFNNTMDELAKLDPDCPKERL